MIVESYCVARYVAYSRFNDIAIFLKIKQIKVCCQIVMSLLMNRISNCAFPNLNDNNTHS